ncbi:cytochrome P450 3A5-like [Oculina patagonica]
MAIGRVVLLQDVLLSCAVIFLVWFILKVLIARFTRKRASCNLPPGPPPHLLSGNTAIFRSNVVERHTRLLELHKKYGKVVRIQMGRPPLYGTDIFSVGDPHLCEEVLKSKSYALSKLTQARFQMFIGNYGLNSMEGATWKKHRKLIMPLFHSGFLSYALDVITDKTEVLVKKLKDLPDSSSVEVYLLIKNLALDIISKAAFGYDLRVQENPDDNLVKAVNSFLDYAGDVAFLALPWLWTWMHPFKAFQIHRQRKVLDNLITQIINQRKCEDDDDDDKRDLLTLLLRAQDPESKYTLSNIEVHDEILTFLFGGFETTASQLCWILYHLAQHPNIQAAAQEEVDRVLGNSDVVTSGMEKELKYVANCIKESQRLVPVITGFSRGAVEDAELGGFHIPKGSVLFLDSYVLHHLDKFWDKPEVFDPTRWEDKMAVRTFSFLPFGGGSRRCAGQPFAVVEMKAVVALILKNFSLKLDESKPISTEVKIAFGPRKINFFFTRR